MEEKVLIELTKTELLDLIKACSWMSFTLSSSFYKEYYITLMNQLVEIHNKKFKS